MDKLLHIDADLNLGETTFKEIFFIECATFDVLLHNVEVLFVMEK